MRLQAILSGTLAAGFLLTGSCDVESQSRNDVPYVVLERVYDARSGFFGIGVSVENALTLSDLKHVTCQVISLAKTEDPIGEDPKGFTIQIYGDLSVSEYRPGFGGLSVLDEFRAQHLLSFYRWNRDLESLGIGIVTDESGERHQPAQYHAFDHTVDCN